MTQRPPFLTAFACITWLFSSQPATAQNLSQTPFSQGYPATVSARLEPDSAAPGERIKLLVAVDLNEGFHTYDIVQPEADEVATRLTADLPASLQPLGDWTGPPPEEKLENLKPILLHHASPTWQLDLLVQPSAPPGELRIAGKIRFLVCSETGCLPPRTEPFELALQVRGEPVAGALAPNESSGLVPAEFAQQAGPAADPVPADQANRSANLELPTFTPKHVDFVIDNLWMALAAGLLAGLILNVMPCVLPVISLKIYGYVRQAGDDRRRIRAMGLSFCAGIISVFLAFGALFAFAGQTWGELFQSDIFNVGMVAILVGCALWMFEVFIFTVPGIVSDADAAVSTRKDLAGEFFKGILATLLSTPCSGPLLIPVISFALKTQSAPIIFATLTSVGLGMAFPYLLLAWKPGWMRLMPKPGDWMKTFKELMGFLLLGTAIWLLWQRRRNGELVVWTVSFSTFVGLAGWLYGRWSDPIRSAAKRYAAPVLALVIILFGGYFSFGLMYNPPSPATARSGAPANPQLPARSVDSIPDPEDYHWQPFDLNAFLTAQKNGRNIVVDWTADW